VLLYHWVLWATRGSSSLIAPIIPVAAGSMIWITIHLPARTSTELGKAWFLAPLKEHLNKWFPLVLAGHWLLILLVLQLGRYWQPRVYRNWWRDCWDFLGESLLPGLKILPPLEEVKPVTRKGGKHCVRFTSKARSERQRRFGNMIYMCHVQPRRSF